MAPQVQSLADVLAELNPAYSAQEDIIKQQQAGLGAKYGAQQSALEAKKVKGFNTINTQANAKGMAFSGIPVDEQAQYLAETYLPGMQQLTSQQNQESLALQKELASIGTEKRTRALSTIEQQKQDLNSWNQMQAQLAATAEQNRLDREAEAANAAANRAATQAAQYQTVDQALNDLGTTFVSGKGYARFVTGTDKNGKPISQTREQAAYALASAANIPYDQALQKIYAKFKTAESK